MTLFLRNLASSLSDNIGTGTVLRFVLVAIDNDIAGGEAAPSSTPYTSTSHGRAATSTGRCTSTRTRIQPHPVRWPSAAAGNEPYSPNRR